MSALGGQLVMDDVHIFRRFFPKEFDRRKGKVAATYNGHGATGHVS